MGKTTVLTHVSKQIKRNFLDEWVVRIDLNVHIYVLKALNTKQIDRKKATEYVSERLLKQYPGLCLELFTHCC